MASPESGIPVLSPCVSLPLSENELVSVVDKAKDWALMHGVGMRNKKEFSKDSLQVNLTRRSVVCLSDRYRFFVFFSDSLLLSF